MDPATLRPIPDRPVLELVPPGRDSSATLVLADLHLGLGNPEDRRAGPEHALPSSMARELVRIARDRSARGFLIAGDAKHPIFGTPPALRPVVFDFFSTLLSEGFEVELVPGNHDVGLVRYLPKEVVVHRSDGVVRHGIGIFHGHRWPSDPVLRAARIVCGHLHPGYRLAPTSQYALSKQRCWLRVGFSPPATQRTRRRRRRASLAAQELIVLPAFHPLCASEAMNRFRPSRGRTFLVNRFLNRGTCRAYLLDGTDLGVVETRGARDPRS